ncbi:NADH dehydrogenase subunit 6 (mitochondrion) [Galleria mellonella]|uniref:NADH-ubiquinone oxidoreductase chain 6 n=1 Tax=Galleria mellonella TaxID=7137 RepID=A0A0S1YD53_GALME|nr:NADH dehydrogenase subunit 6 [Galleria mellonella]ALM88180.1 NADH dehydrogenase subunit 6 [Galleria mellonella]
MLKMFFFMMIMSLSILMFFMNHPLSMGISILFQTLMICLLSGMLIKTYWFSYILFLTFMGGLLVLFIYVSSIASNEMFKISSLNKMSTITFLMINFIFSYIFFYNLNWLNFSINLEEMNNFMQTTMFFFNNENKINLSKLYNNQTFMMMMMLVIYLFITLIAVVKITNIFFGPLRSS